MEARIQVLRVRPHREPDVVTLENDLTPLQEAVGGNIEFVSIDDGVDILLNEEGKLIGLEGNRRYLGDVLCGTFYVVGFDEDGNLTSLPDSMMEKYTAVFLKPEDDITQEEIERCVKMSFMFF